MLAIDIAHDTGCIYTADQAGRVCVWRPTDAGRTVYASAVFTGDIPAKKAAGATTVE